jgi:AraC-like DNA-binding protein
MNTDFNFVVTDISFVVHRITDKKWHLQNMINKSNYILAFAIEGNALYQVDDKEIDIKKGDALFFQKGQNHTGTTNPENPWSYYSIAFDLEDLSEDKGKSILNITTVTTLKNFIKYDEKLKQLNIAWTTKSTGYLLECRSIITELLFFLVTERTTTGKNDINIKKIEKIKKFLSENYDKSYTCTELAAMADVSPSHFRMIFKFHTGYTPIEYQNFLKINKACDILLSGACNVTETAYSLGYDDIFYFSRLFKKITGTSPTEYTKKCKRQIHI